MTMLVDRWGDEIAGTPDSVAAWDEAWQRFVTFTGDPVAALTPATETDDTFVLGAVFDALYRVLAGSPLDAPALAALVDVGRSRACTPRESAHVQALDLLVAGEFTAAGVVWASIARETDDFSAARFAHDVFLHVGDDDRRLALSTAALAAHEGRSGWSFVAGQHSFALNEVGRYAEAADIGRVALEADPSDLWARHALAHVYEETDDTSASLVLLRDTADVWAGQDLLANHVWWHLALRLLAAGEHDEVLAIHDERMSEATTAFRLCDQTSILWRAELAGVDVGDRWDELADRWDTISERHTCGFIDLHAVLAYLRRPDHPGAGRWRVGLRDRVESGSEIDEIFAEVVEPLVRALDTRSRGDLDTAADAVAGLGDTVSRIGGSNAQRAIVPLTFSTSAHAQTGAPR
ncbi:MAG: hypothetical protein ACO3WU_02580 [Ilumatobacteraceae bacterium]